MDLNKLFFRHQIALMRSEAVAEPDERRRLHLTADTFAADILAVRLHLGARAASPQAIGA